MHQNLLAWRIACQLMLWDIQPSNNASTAKLFSPAPFPTCGNLKNHNKSFHKTLKVQAKSTVPYVLSSFYSVKQRTMWQVGSKNSHLGSPATMTPPIISGEPKMVVWTDFEKILGLCLGSSPSGLWTTCSANFINRLGPHVPVLAGEISPRQRWNLS